MSTLQNKTMAGVAIKPPLPALISDDTAEFFCVVNYSILGGLVATFGIFTNIINILVFLTQGFTDIVNVSLFSLSVFDLSSEITLTWVSLLWNPLFHASGVPMIFSEVLYLTGGWPHVFMLRTTSWITAYITLERCLCVLIPLRVKALVTHKFAVSALVSIVLINFAIILPELSTEYIGWKFDHVHNRSMLGLIFTKGRDEMNVLSYTLGGYLQITSALFVVMFTNILVVKMKQKSRWRETAANVGHESLKGTRNRDTKTIKMVILIAVIFCVCYMPTIVASLTTTLEPSFNIVGYNYNLFFVVWSFAMLADSINSSVNIFVYYRMSSKYKSTCDNLLNKLSLKHKVNIDAFKT